MNRIRQARKERGMSQKQVALELGVKGPSVSNWESGKTTPTKENYIAMSSLFHVSVDYLMGIDDIPDEKIKVPIEYHVRFGPETQKVINELLAKLRSMPDKKQEEAARGALTYVRGVVSAEEQEGKA